MFFLFFGVHTSVIGRLFTDTRRIYGYMSCARLYFAPTLLFCIFLPHSALLSHVGQKEGGCLQVAQSRVIPDWGVEPRWR